jgi:thiamine-monophosphate kinase
VILGIGDDCAIVRAPGSSEDWVITTDLLIEDVHFRRSGHPPSAVGHKALARGLSDIAAMGASPRFCLLSLALPEWAGGRWLDAFYRGFLKLAGQSGAAVVGGDLAQADKFTCDIVVCGGLPRGQALRRDRAEAGDAIYVSGLLGGSALGLETSRGRAWQRHLRPQPRLKLGEYLRRKRGVHSAMDLSDGLSIDLHRLARESGVAAVIDRPLPVFHNASLDQALHGGEDYELLFAVAPDVKVPLHHQQLPLTRIGTIEEGRPGAVEFFGKTLQPGGWDHFRRTKSV